MAPIERRIAVPGLADSSQFAYAQCVATDDLIFVAGQTGMGEDGKLVSNEIEEQSRATFRNIEKALRVFGAGLDDLVSMTVSITDWRLAPDFLAVRKEVLGEALAASALIGVTQLWHPNALVEVQAIAARPKQS
jgi:2-iminobutanoate/2-iminopropanoate deaminase